MPPIVLAKRDTCFVKSHYVEIFGNPCDSLTGWITTLAEKACGRGKVEVQWISYTNDFGKEAFGLSDDLEIITMAFGTEPTPTGLADPPIDDLMEHADSKYALAIFAAKRARQINSYFTQLNEGLLQNVGPLVEYQNQEKPLSIAFREINSGLLEETLGEDDLTEGN